MQIESWMVIKPLNYYKIEEQIKIQSIIYDFSVHANAYY